MPGSARPPLLRAAFAAAVLRTLTTRRMTGFIGAGLVVNLLVIAGSVWAPGRCLGIDEAAARPGTPYYNESVFLLTLYRYRGLRVYESWRLASDAPVRPDPARTPAQARVRFLAHEPLPACSTFPWWAPETRHYFRAIQTNGWPWPAAWCEYDLDGRIGKAAAARGGVVISGRRVLPLRPMIGGMLGNTLVFGVGAWALVAGPRLGRALWRGRHGRCVVCGYDLAGALAGGCPECGWGRV